jgi:hypothetical protein
MFLTSTLPGIPRSFRWPTGTVEGASGRDLVVPTPVARAHQVLDADD